MLTLAAVEEILDATLPVPSQLPALWGTILSADWQVKLAAKAARLQLVLGGRASDRPGLITIDYEAEERPDVEATGVDPWHLGFYASAKGVTLLSARSTNAARWMRKWLSWTASAPRRCAS